ncbi:MAG TPA: N-acetyltransferase [Croceibacterium sp.]|nr:N-acetyltransferase [Croceibacterium sp.]
MTDWTIRGERPDDHAAIAALTEAAFREARHADGSEGAIPARLRAAGELTVSLVVEAGGELVGHVAFSPVAIADGTEGWYGLGPVSVIPARQGRGIGTALVRQGLERLRRLGAGGCVVLGEPAYYGRFGFRHDPQLTYPGPPPDYFLTLVLAGAPPAGEVRYAAAFG